jgi:predicted DCC family thiol-disulfide oxidoreductase YuxK
MRLQLLLPHVEPDQISAPRVCPYLQCGGRHFRLHQAVAKPVRDTVYQAVTALRYECLRCRRTFRVYPQGVSRACTSQQAITNRATTLPHP